MSDPVNAASELRTQSPERLWAVSAESVYSALASRATGTPIREQIEPHLRAETIRTNDERAKSPVVTIHEWLLVELGFVQDDSITLLGMVILVSDKPQPFIRAAAVARLQSAQIVLHSCYEVDNDIPRSELDSLLADEEDEVLLAPLLASFGFMTIFPDGVDLNQPRIETALSAQQSQSTQRAVEKAYRVVLSHVVCSATNRCVEDLIERLTGRPTEGGDVGVMEIATIATSPEILVDETEISDLVSDQRQSYEEDLNTVRSLLIPSTESTVKLVETDTSIRFDDPPSSIDLEHDTGLWEAAFKLISTIAAEPDLSTFDVRFITEQWSNVTPYSLYQTLSSVPGVDCEISDELVQFQTVPKAVNRGSMRNEYTAYLVDRCAAIQNHIESLSQATVSIPPTPISTESMVLQDYEQIDSGAIAPTYFTYTLLNPDALGENKMDAYTGESRGLGREKVRLRRWHERRTTGAKPYTSMTDRLFSIGLERDIEEKVLRIMTPYDDDTFNEYVSQIRRLIEQGFELRLLTRHTKNPWEWRRLQRNLLNEIKQHRERVTIRTYSRFKQHQRVTPDMDFRNIGEFGIHGKLQIVGAPKEGAALLGSANFMENSYDWNPECGVYTERTQFVDAAIDFFDIIWDISAADELSIERLQKIPNQRLVPTFYN